MSPWIGLISYTHAARAWLQSKNHYLGNAPPGCLYAVGVAEPQPGLFVEPQPGRRTGICLVSRPVARGLPQDGSMGEVTRLWLEPGLPYGTASAVLRYAAELGRARGLSCLISYHDRTRHTGCIYRKAGFKKWGTTAAKAGAAWGSRSGRAAATYKATPKRRWRLDL
jgi:hypothetical protein|uniref:Uncharacterized protein n=1 Tax=uncultured marine virus TaxID=186617 RepID=A0A0F7L8I6_9VIRU|nr:hypothetical protein [uncultured marine virus]